MAGSGAMRRERFSHVLLIALCLSAPAFAYTTSGVDDAANPGGGGDNPGLDVTRHAMPPPDVTAKPAQAPTVAANPLWAIAERARGDAYAAAVHAVAASAGAGRGERAGRGAAAAAPAAGGAAASELDLGRHGCRRKRG